MVTELIVHIYSNYRKDSMCNSCFNNNKVYDCLRLVRKHFSQLHKSETLRTCFTIYYFGDKR